MKIYFSEYMDEYGKLEGAFTLEVIKKAPFPKETLALRSEGIRDIWHETKRRGYGYCRATGIVRYAEKMIELDDRL